ncbi:MAG: FHA domain-containing protein [Lachnospiraceae bacterium]|jgi:hypothetical protein|nr:FHA domain-containing protein [Lachnospiraceae bacterium]
MNLIKCPNNHFYNADHFPSCPHCANTDSSDSTNYNTNESDINTSPVERNIEEMQSQNKHMLAGWLVCIDGAEYGKYYPLFCGSNAIGRGANMDVQITSDVEISRQTHAEIIYDADRITYSIVVNRSSNPVYVNGAIITTDTDKPFPLQDRDRIRIGSHTFILATFCNNDFSWR